MSRIYYTLIYIFYLFGILSFLLLERNQYAWLQNELSVPDNLPVDNNVSIKVALTIIILGIILLSQLYLFRTFKKRHFKILSVILGVFAILIWYVGFFKI